MITAQNAFYKLDTDNTSYIFRSARADIYSHLYYEEKFMRMHRFFAKNMLAYPRNTNIYSPDLIIFTLEDMCLEMSSWGKG